MRYSYCVIALLFVAACNPPAVDPDAEFTINGAIEDQLGEAQDGVTVRIYKVDSPLFKDSNFLQDTYFEDGLTEYETTSGTDGDFSITLRGSDVNRDDGTGAAYLTVVYFDGGQKGASLATGTEWNFFRDADPVWDIGTLKLWDGGGATQYGDEITFDWTADAAPEGNDRVAGRPTFLFAWNAVTSNDQPDWADHTFDTTSVAPAAVFGYAADAPQYFLVSFSQPDSDSRIYQHRTSLREVSGWSGSTASPLGFDLYEGATNVPFSGEAANDGNVDTVYMFGAGTHELYIDLRSDRNFSEVLLQNLGIVALRNAEVTLSISSNAEPTTWDDLAGTVEGDWEFDNWVYLRNDAGGTAHWIRVSVERQGTTGSYPEFSFVSEVRVLL